MSLSKMNISLDSTIFRNSDFLLWLKRNKENFNISLSVIVELETYHWYVLRSIPDAIFNNLIKSLDAKVIDLSRDQIGKVSKNTIISRLQFKHHIRDIIIASHANYESAIVITDNIRHFSWMENQPMNPDDLILLMSTN